MDLEAAQRGGGADGPGQAVTTPRADAAPLALIAAKPISAPLMAPFIGLARLRLATWSGKRGTPRDLDG